MRGYTTSSRDGIVVEREKSPQDWLSDLWLAERLAARL